MPSETAQPSSPERGLPHDGLAGDMDARPGAPAPLNGRTASGEQEDADLEALREILVGRYQRRAQELQVELATLQQHIEAITLRIEDKQALIDTITPIMSSSIRQSIHDSKGEMVEALHPIMAESIQQSIEESKDEMVEALYPIVGRLVSRSVSEAMRELARRIDDQMRTRFSPATISRHLRARLGGVSAAELAMRNALPFSARRVFLIDRESGLLLGHASLAGESSADSDVIGSMLTAIRDFVDDAFGRGEEGELDTIRYGDHAILIETARQSYIAVVTTGIIPESYPAKIRHQLYTIEERYGKALRTFDGDLSVLTGVSAYLAPLLPAENRSSVAAARSLTMGTQPADAGGQISRSAILILLVITLLLLAGAWWLLLAIGAGPAVALLR